MSDTTPTPLERAAEEVKTLWLLEEVDFEKVARDALTAALDRDELARVIDPHAAYGLHGDGSPRVAEAHRKADAVIAHLTRGAR